MQKCQSFNTQPPEGGCRRYGGYAFSSRHGFNTQPPEGGCKGKKRGSVWLLCFNTQPPEGGCRYYWADGRTLDVVSTHSRPKAAARLIPILTKYLAFQHTAARRRLRRLHHFNWDL